VLKNRRKDTYQPERHTLRSQRRELVEIPHSRALSPLSKGGEGRGEFETCAHLQTLPARLVLESPASREQGEPMPALLRGSPSQWESWG
jgi:hypothetical protein